MKAFLTNLFVKIRLVLIAISHWPVIEPVLELLSLQRTGVLIAGTVGSALVPKLFPGLDAETQKAIITLVIAGTLFFFYGLQREVWKEAEATALPQTPEDWLAEIRKLLDARNQTKLPDAQVFGG